jgi:prepilin-type processing-associated H-X9-DG protein
VVSGGGPNRWRPGWRPYTAAYDGLYAPYIKNRQLFTCPSAQQLAETSYALSRSLGAASLAALAYPSQRVIVADGMSSWGLCGSNRSSSVCNGTWGYGDGSANVRALYTRHNGGGNVLYGDGHVKWQIPPSALNAISAADCNRMWQNAG